MNKKLWKNVTNVHIKCTNTKSNKKCNKKCNKKATKDCTIFVLHFLESDLCLTNKWNFSISGLNT